MSLVKRGGAERVVVFAASRFKAPTVPVRPRTRAAPIMLLLICQLSAQQTGLVFTIQYTFATRIQSERLTMVVVFEPLRSQIAESESAPARQLTQPRNGRCNENNANLLLPAQRKWPLSEVFRSPL